jgi:hypothetical protein
MADISDLQDACVAAETAKAELLVTRRANRDSMSKRGFREYNEATRAEQIQVEADVQAANQALQDGLNEVRSDAVAQVVDVGTLNEGNQPQGVNTDG